jgi:hypothetical protein
MLSVSTESRSPQKQFDAALYSKEDAIEGVSECIIMGNPAANCGTSMSVIREVRIRRSQVLTISDLQGLVGCRSTCAPAAKASSLRECLQARSGEGEQELTLLDSAEIRMTTRISSFY